jgi:hypothetical protein
MRTLAGLLGAAAIPILAGCTALPAPDSGLIDRKPVAQLGDGEPAKPGDYILRIPAGEPVPIKLSLRGSLFKTGEDVEAEVRVSRDLYLYKYWASYDGKDWKRWNELVGVKVSSGVGTNGAQFDVQVNDNAGPK